MEEEYFYELPIESSNLNCIDTNLWLGNLAAASNVEMLREKNVRYILTVNSFPLPKKIRNLGFIENKYIEVYDTPEDDLLSHFEETYEFIQNGVRKGVVLVHCYFGASRSATIVISYLMKKHKISLEKSLSLVKSKRESIAPNAGFLDQLKLYEVMEHKLNRNNVQYKMFRLEMAVHHLKKTKGIPEHYADVVEVDPLEESENSDPVVYKCRKCRRVLARGSNDIPHSPNERYSWTDSESSYRTNICTLKHFIQPFIWMENVKVCSEGKIHCPNRNCANKLGSFDWISGIRCPCGTQVRPGFYLIPSKVDKISIKK